MSSDAIKNAEDMRRESWNTEQLLSAVCVLMTFQYRLYVPAKMRNKILQFENLDLFEGTIGNKSILLS